MLSKFLKFNGGSGSKATSSKSATPRSSAPRPVKRVAQVAERRTDARRISEMSEDFRTYLRDAGQVVTAKGQVLDRGDETRRYCALFERGLLVINETKEGHPLITTIQRLAPRHSIAIREVVLSRADVLAEIYEEDARRRNIGGKKKERQTEEVDQILALVRKAIDVGASDIHLGIMNGQTIVRLREDSVLKEQRPLDADDGLSLMSAAWHLSEGHSDTTYNPLIEQSARITRESCPALPMDIMAIRMQWIPVAPKGRALFMRLLSGSKGNLSLGNLGYLEEQIEEIDRAAQVPFGMNILSGPVGSGKTTSMAAMIEHIYDQAPTKPNIVTVEDPVELPIRGALQMPVSNNKAGEDRGEQFIRAARSLLRSDAQIALIGELRDVETAVAGIRSAMTGQQVYTTLHTNSAIACLPRLENMGVPPFDLYVPETIVSLTWQRLLRKVCPHCAMSLAEAREHDARHPAGSQLPDETVKTQLLVTDDLMRALSETMDISLARILFARPEGCGQCFNGYKGRTVVAEIIRTTEEFMEAMARHDRREAKEIWLRNGGIPAMGHGLARIAEGVTTPQEVMRVLGPLYRPEGPGYQRVMSRILGASGHGSLMVDDEAVEDRSFMTA